MGRGTDASSGADMSGLPSWARVGAKVVCVTEHGRGLPSDWDAGPQVGEVYTISRAYIGFVGALAVPSITLAECPVIDLLTGQEWAGYDVDRFRPVVTIEDDLEAHFTTLLHVPAGQKADA